jgi:hypothetical protein
MPRLRAPKDDVLNDKPAPACLVTVTGPAKGHPPVAIPAYGRTPKEAVNALRRLLFNGTLEVTT